jgi:hypothetical protein
MDALVEPGRDEFFLGTPVGPPFPRSSIGQNIAIRGELAVSTNMLDQLISMKALMLGAVSVACTALPTMQPTSIVGAVLWTGYVGDVVIAHLRIF